MTAPVMAMDGKKQRKRAFSVHDVGFFEGAEKLLEMWFDFPQHKNGAALGLRIIPKSKWEELLDLVKCKIISSCSNNHMDAYLLSESSMFVSRNRFILKTCGTTTLLQAIDPLMQLVLDAYPGAVVMDIFYSHRNFQKPHLQSHPHQSFQEEACYLDKIFEDGAAYALGRLNGDAWYLYTMENKTHPLEVQDQTLEILMTGLDPGFMSLFSSEVYSTGEELTRAVGLSDLIPGAIVDAKVFGPCGYSLNAIVQDDIYFTIHVTPQVECSYVSFETNIPWDSYDSLINKVITIFHPHKCTLTLFASKTARCGLSFTAFQDQVIRGYHCKDRQFCSFLMYNLTFAHYSKEPSYHDDGDHTHNDYRDDGDHTNNDYHGDGDHIHNDYRGDGDHTHNDYRGDGDHNHHADGDHNHHADGDNSS